MRRHSLLTAAGVAAALALAGTALAVAPWPGLARSVTAPGGDTRYVAVRGGENTTVRAIRGGDVVATQTVQGLYGIPAVTVTGTGGGLSPNGKTLVLVQPPADYSTLRRQSRFVLLRTADLSVARTIVLKGEFGFDALSPDGRTLYLLEHANRTDLVQYRVRAYDLRAGRLVQRVIVDKREPDEKMVGWAVARATTATGGWVYTLYTRQQGEPFVHALAANQRAAFCIDLPWEGSTQGVWTARLALSRDEKQLAVRTADGRTVVTVDTVKMKPL